jgi:hypothetical protein
LNCALSTLLTWKCVYAYRFPLYLKLVDDE